MVLYFEYRQCIIIAPVVILRNCLYIFCFIVLFLMYFFIFYGLIEAITEAIHRWFHFSSTASV